jgi:phosphatidylserine/phosphatidylglycerophosphate/cardiolipin synthase-like enzyme
MRRARAALVFVAIVGFAGTVPLGVSAAAPAGATAQCRDGTYSYSQHRSGTCSDHGGVATWLTPAAAPTPVATTPETAAAAATNAAPTAAVGGLSLITEPDDGYGPIDTLLASPKRDLDLTMYELQDTKAEEILAADAERGVTVRVLLDRDYIGDYNGATFSYLRDHGVQVRWASSQVEITHEKSFVIDKSTAVIMTGNLTSEYYATTRDFAVVDTTAADVAAVEQTFDLDWADERGTPPTGADLVWSPGSEQVLVSLIDSAHESLLVENEELKAPEIVSALEDAARRGVRVEVVMTRASEWDDNFDALADDGVDVHTYSPSAALYIHAKVIDADGARAFIGSENFSVGSMQYNRELGLITSEPAIVGAVGRTLTSDFDGAAPWPA